jgi:hypothetical protein
MKFDIGEFHENGQTPSIFIQIGKFLPLYVKISMHFYVYLTIGKILIGVENVRTKVAEKIFFFFLYFIHVLYNSQGFEVIK